MTFVTVPWVNARRSNDIRFGQPNPNDTPKDQDPCIDSVVPSNWRLNHMHYTRVLDPYQESSVQDSRKHL